MYENSNYGNPHTLSKWIKNKGFDKNLSIKLFVNEKCICSIEGRNVFTITGFDRSEEVERSLMNAGFVNIFLFYTDSSNPRSGNHSINLDMDISKWFLNHFDDCIIVPDTNIILNRLFSSLDIITREDITKQIKIKIPRLSILELEKKANQDKNKTWKKRGVFLGYSELIYLKENGAMPMKELSIETLTGFSKIRGNEKTDEWIRREINEAKKISKSNRLAEGFLGEGAFEKFDKYIFITSDLINSMSSISENIDTIYVSKFQNWENKLREGNLLQVSKLITTMSLLYEDLIAEINSEKIKFQGMWSGKTMWDYTKEHFKFELC